MEFLIHNNKLNLKKGTNEEDLIGFPAYTFERY